MSYELNSSLYTAAVSSLMIRSHRLSMRQKVSQVQYNILMGQQNVLSHCTAAAAVGTIWEQWLNFNTFP